MLPAVQKVTIKSENVSENVLDFLARNIQTFCNGIQVFGFLSGGFLLNHVAYSSGIDLKLLV